MTFADRVTQLTAEGAYHMLARAQALEAAGRHIIHLEVGQPDVPAPEHVTRGHRRHSSRAHALWPSCRIARAASGHRHRSLSTTWY